MCRIISALAAAAVLASLLGRSVLILKGRGVRGIALALKGKLPATVGGLFCLSAILSGIGRSQWPGHLGALAMVAIVTLIIGVVESLSHLANISMLYLIAVLMSAIVFGRGPAVLAALCSLLAFDWFFVEPLHTLTVNDPNEWVILLLFLITALTTGQLTAVQRQRTREAREREREAVLLYDTLRLLGQPDLQQALRAIAERLRQELGAPAVGIRVDDSGESVKAVAGDREELEVAVGKVPTRLLSEGPEPTEARPGETGRWIRIVSEHSPGRGRRHGAHQLQVIPIKAQCQRRGTLLILLPAEAAKPTVREDRFLAALAAQIGLALEHRRLEREANQAEVLRQADELKTALLNTVSHNLRTPLSTILTLAGGLRQGEGTWAPEDVRETGRTIEHEVHRLNQMVGNLLDLSRLESGNLRPQMAWHDLGALIEDVLYRLRALTADHRVVVTVAENLPPIQLDYVEIDQVLSNLVENAARHTPPGTPIEISARREGEVVRVEVADRGPGLASADPDLLFQPFYRLERSRLSTRGIGLGLAVAKGLVEAHGGTLVASNRPGGGASFAFTLPLRNSPKAGPQPEEQLP